MPTIPQLSTRLNNQYGPSSMITDLSSRSASTRAFNPEGTHTAATPSSEPDFGVGPTGARYTAAGADGGSPFTAPTEVETVAYAPPNNPGTSPARCRPAHVPPSAP